MDLASHHTQLHQHRPRVSMHVSGFTCTAVCILVHDWESSQREGDCFKVAGESEEKKDNKEGVRRQNKIKESVQK